MRSRAAVEKCAQWLAYCVAIGWAREKLDALESLWWQHHDCNGDMQ